MARPKIPRKSTTVDMTAMCDVAFLLLSFFILTTKPKPSEAVPISTPTSVAAKIAPEKDLVMISLNKDGKVFLSTGDGQEDKDTKKAILQSINTAKNLGLTDQEIALLVRAPFIGSPLPQLKQQARLAPEQMTAETLNGISVKDTANNEMMDWMRAIKDAYTGKSSPNILLKGDNVAKYPAFKNIVAAMKKNDLLKIQMVTNPEAIPAGTSLFTAIQNGNLKAAE